MEQRLRLSFGQLRQHLLRQLPGDIGILGGIDARFFHLDLGKTDLLLAAAGDIAIGNGAIIEQIGSQSIHAVRFGGRIGQVGGDHGVAGYPLDVDSCPPQHQCIVLDVLTDLGFPRVFE